MNDHVIRYRDYNRPYNNAVVYMFIGGGGVEVEEKYDLEQSVQTRNFVFEQ